MLFCDLANSTAMAACCGPDNRHTLLNHFFELALDAVHRYEGTINQFLGDGFMALFGAPIAHEDHARRAVLAALDLQRTLHSQHEELGASYGVRCAFRMGLNSGLVVVGSIGDNLRMDYSAIGDTTNVAARLRQLAEPDTIAALASEKSYAHGPLTGWTSSPSFQTCALPLDGTALWPKGMPRLLSVPSTPYLPGKRIKQENPRKEIQPEQGSRLLRRITMASDYRSGAAGGWTNYLCGFASGIRWSAGHRRNPRGGIDRSTCGSPVDD